ncbi:hypothetical protein A0H81_05062 [Grifola frondosa]|uniref:CsbD-like domain-containing protein n=1 Tax=Grifola frondosa TaxID=5627 RepID=A0A1C7MIZ9_GRIFR|nr:hypothetical protein A0H81_05062 [Grifola frondosa]
MSDLPPVIATNAGTPPDEWARTTTSAAFAPPAPSPSSTQPLNPPAAAEPEPTTKPHDAPTSSTSTPGAELPGAYPATQKSPRRSQRRPPPHRAWQSPPSAPYRASSTRSRLTCLVRRPRRQRPNATWSNPPRANALALGRNTSAVLAPPGYVHRGRREVPRRGALQHRCTRSRSNPAALATATKEGETTQQQGTPTHHAPPAAPSTLPSQEPFGAAPHEHSSGAGRLPGNMSEASVAKLPAERAQENLPTHEEGGNAPGEHVSGVGALVGAQSEAGVAVLPEERAQVDPGKGEVLAQKETEMKGKEKQHGEEKATTEAAGAHKGAETQVSGGFGVDVDADEGDAQAHLSHVNLRPRTHALGLRGAHWAGVAIGAGGGYVRGEGIDIAEGEAYDTDYHPAAMHPMTGGAQVPAKGKEEAKEQPHGAAQEKPEGEPREKEKEKEKTKKAGFMEKMRGEAKVLLGKVEGKPAMVEEGKRMKAGEARAGEVKAGEAKAGETKA